MSAPAYHLGTCTSTNDEAARLGREGAPHGTVVTAGSQRGGRGRLGRSWHSPPDENLYLSLLLRPPFAPLQAPLLTLCAGVALAEAARDALQQAAPERDPAVELKWPNDLLIQGKKAGGVLTELVLRGERIDFVVIGVGVNLLSREFPGDLASRATSLGLCLGDRPAPDPAAFAARLLERLHPLYEQLLREGFGGGLRDRYRGFAAFLRRPEDIAVRCGAELVRGRPTDLSEEGALLLREGATGALRALFAGEVLDSGTAAA